MSSVPFSTAYLDPPWPEHGGGKSKRGADKHYGLQKVDDIPPTILMSGAWNPAPDGHMYEWVTDNYLPDGIWVMRQLGFRYIRTLPWIKLKDEAFEDLQAMVSRPGFFEELRERGIRTLAQWFEAELKIGIGQYFRGASEICLFGVRGKGKAVCKPPRNLRNVILGPRGEHSRKPLTTYDLIEARSIGPYAEFYARSRRPGWTSWGDQL